MDQAVPRSRKVSAFAVYNKLSLGVAQQEKTVSIVDLTESTNGVGQDGLVRKRKANDVDSQKTQKPTNEGRKSKKKRRRVKNASGHVVNGNAADVTADPTLVDHSDSDQASEGIVKILDGLTYEDSGYDGRLVFAALIDPIPISTFLDQYWEKRPLLIQRPDDRQYFGGLFSSGNMNEILNAEDVQYSVNLDITKYENGERKTLNPIGRAYPATVWKFYQEGCSIRLLNPQTYSDAVWKLNSTLQEYFGTFVGANVYLTPADTQGFAPHYDDIEAFVLQLEGAKRWKIYKPRNEAETLPRFSSPNFKSDEIGKPIMEVELKPGDLLYFPRGYIHQAVACDGQHSLHITVSSTQRNTWADLIQMLMEQAVHTAMQENVELRRALPLSYMDFMGTVHMDTAKKGRKAFIGKAKELMTGLINYASIDAAVDQMAKNYTHESLPPKLTADEKKRSILGERKDGRRRVLHKKTKIKLIRKHCLRLVMESEEDVSVYYNTENSRVYRQKEPQRFDIEPELAAGVDFLVEKYPKYVRVGDLPLESANDQVRLCQMLYEKALLTVDE